MPITESKTTVIVRAPHAMGRESKEELKKEVLEAFGDVRVLILDQGKTLEVPGLVQGWDGAI